MIPITDDNITSTRATALGSMVMLNAVVFALTLALPDELREWLYYIFGIMPARHSHPRWAQRHGLPAHDDWPFVTRMFLHGG